MLATFSNLLAAYEGRGSRTGTGDHPETIPDHPNNRTIRAAGQTLLLPSIVPPPEFICSIPHDLFPDRFLDELKDRLGHRFSVLFTDFLEPSLEIVGDIRHPDSAHFSILALPLNLSSEILESPSWILILIQGMHRIAGR